VLSNLDTNYDDRHSQRDPSMLTFEGVQTQGVNSIVEKLVSLPFQKVAHRISTVDAQPSNPNNQSIVVTVTGQLLVSVLHRLQ
jgi:Nuclear transport factor 2 (NTF2) domain